jgi:glucose-6-phosphate 1-epimerase/putative transcriptional regulator
VQSTAVYPPALLAARPPARPPEQIIHIMHGFRLERAVEVVPGVFVGGEAAATGEVQARRLPAEPFKFFAGAVVWEGGQLQQEVDDGAW